ncbi:hypothetical protein AKJ16_DCAP20910 [Drosera capensis]
MNRADPGRFRILDFFPGLLVVLVVAIRWCLLLGSVSWLQVKLVLLVLLVCYNGSFYWLQLLLIPSSPLLFCSATPTDPVAATVIFLCSTRRSHRRLYHSVVVFIILLCFSRRSRRRLCSSTLLHQQNPPSPLSFCFAAPKDPACASVILLCSTSKSRHRLCNSASLRKTYIDIISSKLTMFDAYDLN